MLSASTLDFLDALCRSSHAAYSEGGTLWTYVEAANQAHLKFRDPRRKTAVGPLNLEQLGRWLQWAQGEREEATRPASIEMASRLSALLHEDLDPDEVLWSFEDNGSDMHANIYMARASDNRFFALELWWSED